MIRRTANWLDRRTGWGTVVRAFFNEQIPASSGWLQAIGSVALFLLFVQAFTGVLLALNFAPTPGQAYDSLQYILKEVTGGRLIRGLHHWGASMMIIVLVLHMTQVFLYAAYKKPREVTWMVGVVLFLVTLAFGLTGYLLPWDNRAFWGTVVTTQIAGQAPVLGRYVQRLIGAESTVGAVTFARFYAVHTLVLPTLAFLLTGLHVYLVRRHGVTPNAFDSRPARRFFPEQALKDVAMMFAAFVVLFVLAVAAPAPLEGLADPTDTAYTPRPEWYFLFLFQTLKFFQGPIEPIGSIVLPTAAVVALFAVPFVDRTSVKRVAERTFAISLVLLCAITWTSLTVAAVLTTPRPGLAKASGSAGEGWTLAAPVDLAGLGYFRLAQCSTCHDIVGEGPKPGPTLTGLVPRKSRDQLMDHLTMAKSGADGLKPGDLDALDLFLRRLTRANAMAVMIAPPDMISGARIFVESGCGACHSVNGVGGSVGPALNGVARRYTREWIAQQLAKPESHNPETVMPAFDFTDRERDLVISYLLSLPGK